MITDAVRTTIFKGREVFSRYTKAVAPIAVAVAYSGPPVKICGVTRQTMSRRTPPPTAVITPKIIATKSEVSKI